MNAIRWLNESYAADLYLVKLEGIRINDSLPAPLLTLIVGPSDEQKVVGERKKELAERHHDRKMFWSELLDVAKTRTTLHSNVSPNHDNWISTGAGKSGLAYSYVIKQNEAYVELYINKNGNTEENKSIYDMLYKSKNEIEEIFGEELEWQRLDNRKGCRIMKKTNLGGYKDKEKWSEIIYAMVDSMIRLEKAFSKYIRKLPI